MREVIIDLDAIAYNLDVMRKRAGGVKVCGVVKASSMRLVAPQGNTLVAPKGFLFLYLLGFDIELVLSVEHLFQEIRSRYTKRLAMLC